MNMEDVKTRLDVIRYRGEWVKLGNLNYTDIFKGPESVAKQRCSILRKVLVKGRMGHGKSTMAKKIVFDWAKGQFKTFPLVFFADMRLAKPDETIENIIIGQNSFGSHFLPRKITEILDEFGDEILVIIDGLCDQTVQINKEVLNIIRNTDLNFNLLLTLPESNFTENVDEYFDTICQVQGFDDTDIQSLVSTLPGSQRRVALKWIQSLPEDPEGRNPMLVLLLSFLASQDLTPDLGIYFDVLTLFARTVLCLVGSVDFESKKNEMKAVGKIALDSLQSGKVYTKAELSDPETLHKGLLVESKSSAVSFAHSSLQIFLAAVYTVLELDDEETTVESLVGTNCQKPVLMINPCFLYFCLSLLGEHQAFIVGKSRQNIRVEMKKFILDRIDAVQLDLQSIATIYPALDFSLANNRKDELSLHFLLEILSESKNVQDLILRPSPGLPVHKILSAMKEQFSTLKSIRLLDDDEEIHENITNEFNPDDLSVVIHNQSGHCVDELIEFLQTIERSPCIYYIGGNNSKPMINMSMFPTNTQKLYLVSRKGDRHPWTDLTAWNGIPQWKKLTHLSIPDSKFCTSDQVVKAFSEAFEQRRFPSLRHLSLGVSGLSGKFSQLLKSGCPSLRVLKFLNSFYVRDDKFCWKELLPQLESVTVGDNSYSFKFPSESVTSLSHVELDVASDSEFTKAIKECKLQNITHLELFMIWLSWADGHIHEILNNRTFPSLTHLSVTEKQGSQSFVEKLFRNETVQNLRHFHLSGFNKCTLLHFFNSSKGFPNLQSLAFNGCIKSPNDLRILAQALDIGLLPKLEHLDLSKNDVDDFESLFDFGCKWGNLKSFSIEREGESQSDLPFQDFQCLTNHVQSGCLGNLEKLQVFVEAENFLPTGRFTWSSLRDLGISTAKPVMYKKILTCLGYSYDRGCFPELKVITLSTNEAEDNPQRPCIAREKQRLRGKGVSVYFVTNDEMW